MRLSIALSIDLATQTSDGIVAKLAVVILRTPTSALHQWLEASGIEGMRIVLDDFYSRVIDDTMIGFFFSNRDKATLVRRQLEFTARAFGIAITYQGQSIRDAHAPLPIRPGHFDRRHQILKQTLQDHQLPEEAILAWLAFDRSFRHLVLHAGAALSEP